MRKSASYDLPSKTVLDSSHTDNEIKCAKVPAKEVGKMAASEDVDTKTRIHLVKVL